MDTLRNRHGGQFCEHRAMVCNDCSLVFDVIDANIEREWEEGMYDRPGNWIEYKTCPCCHSVEIERWYPWDAVFKAGG